MRVSPSTALAAIALFFALGGSAIAVNQAVKEITTRYDFKGTAASLEFNRKDKSPTQTEEA